MLDRPCSGAWASTAPHSVTPAQPAKGALREAGLTAFKALPTYAELQRQFVKEEADSRGRSWETVNGELSIVELRPAARSPLLVVSARGGVGCAGFNGRLSGFWQVAGSADAPTLTPLGGAGLKEYVTVHGALDQGATLGLALLAGPDNFNDEVSVIRPATVKDPRRVLHGTSFWDCDC